MNYGKNKYIIERYSVGVEERLKRICAHNIEPRIELLFETLLLVPIVEEPDFAKNRAGP